MKFQKAIAYAYPTSPAARELGHSKTGCYYIARTTKREDGSWSTPEIWPGSEGEASTKPSDLFQLFREIKSPVSRYSIKFKRVGRDWVRKNPKGARPRYKAAKSGDYWKVWDNRSNSVAEGPPHIDKKTAQKYAQIMNNTLNNTFRTHTNPKARFPKRQYEVVVGNVGTVYRGTNENDALFNARTYVDQSKSNRGNDAEKNPKHPKRIELFVRTSAGSQRYFATTTQSKTVKDAVAAAKQKWPMYDFTGAFAPKKNPKPKTPRGFARKTRRAFGKRAAKIIRRAEKQLGPLSPGQRRDLLQDNIGKLSLQGARVLIPNPKARKNPRRTHMSRKMRKKMGEGIIRIHKKYGGGEVTGENRKAVRALGRYRFRNVFKKNPRSMCILAFRKGWGPSAKVWYVKAGGRQLTNHRENAMRFSTEKEAMAWAGNRIKIFARMGMTSAFTVKV